MRLIVRVFVLCLLPALASAQPVQPVQILHQFTPSPMNPAGALVQVPDGSFYGVTSDAVYHLATDGTVVTAARLTDGVGASGALVVGPDGALYGTTQWGGDTGQGTVFRFDPVTGAVRTLHTFTGVHEGTSPFDGLTVLGGQLYGVTETTVFRVDPASGATTILYTFSNEGTPSLSFPSSGLTVGADGLLYGTTLGPTPSLHGTIYRLDPATTTVTVVHQFTDLIEPDGRLLLGPGGWLFGSTLYEDIDFPDVGPGGIYRYHPATNAFEVLARHVGAGSTLPTAPGPLAMMPDGSLYGTTAAEGSPLTTLLCVLFRLRPNGGGYVYEHLRGFDFATTGLSRRVQLTPGADGLLYGHAQDGGAVGAGTLYRFDPAGAGPPANPISFTVLHQFVTTRIWSPSAPMTGPDGRLYGTASSGGGGNRGGIYVLDPATGGFTSAADVPGNAASRHNHNSALTLGPDNALFGTNAAGTASGAENGVLRFVPGINTITNTLNSFVANAEVGFLDSAIARAVSGDLYFTRDRTVYRVAPNGTITPAGSGPDPGANGSTFSTAPVVGGDGQVYVGMTTTSFGSQPFQLFKDARVFRVNQTTSALDEVANFGILFDISGLATAPDGVYVAASFSAGVGSEIRLLNTVTGAQRSICGWPTIGLLSVTPVEDRLVGIILNDHEDQLLVCQVANGASELRTLPATIGAIREPLVAIGGVLYGAASDGAVMRWRGTPSRAPRQPGGAVIRFSVSGQPPALDSEADGLPSEWETTYGLDPFVGTGDDGPGGDPDGDGRTNAQELADGTHPRGVLTRHFAEGATGPFFRTRIDLANPNAGRAANVLVRFLTDDGARIAHHVVVPPAAHEGIDPSTIPGLAHASFSSVIEADLPIGVDRTMTWDQSGYGSHIETGVEAPSTIWYLAEGSTSGAFSLFYLLQNPQGAPVPATVRYLRPFGLPPIEKTYVLPPFSRTTIVVDAQGAELASTDVSAVITAPSPIVVERAMYYSQPQQPFAAGHESAGVTAPALEWFLAEGAAGEFFDLFVLIANPNPSPAVVQIEYLLVGGGALTKTYTVAANSRSTIWVDDEELPAGSGIKPFAGAALSMVVRSTNAVPIVVERTMWWPGPSLTPNYWYEAHNSPGSTTTATRWLVAGADSGGPDDAQTFLLIANPGSTTAQVRVSTLTDAGGAADIGSLTLPAKSRTNFPLAPRLGPAQATVSLLIESEGTSPVPIVVEHATYASPGGVIWARGGNALAAPLP